MILIFIVWTAVFILFFVIGIVTWNSEKTVGFFTGVKPPKVKDIRKYNHAVAKIWFAYAILLEILGVPFLWISEESLYGILVAILVMIWALGLIITYLIVEQKYKE